MAATLKTRFPEIAASIQPKVGAAMRPAAKLVAKHAAERVDDATPIGEGLVASMNVKRLEVGVYEIAAGDGEHFYGHFLEFGHAKRGGGEVAPRPFLVPALEESKDDIEALLMAALRGL